MGDIVTTAIYYGIYIFYDATLFRVSSFLFKRECEIRTAAP